MKVLVLHGPNLNLLGTREVKVYGNDSLAQINRKIRSLAQQNRLTVRIKQSNWEGELIDTIHANRKWADGILINPAAYTHYSIAIRDAIAAVNLPCIEVHLSDIRKRESFRKKSVIKAVCIKQISGRGTKSYLDGLVALKTYLSKARKNPKS